MELQKRYDAYQRAGVAIFAISYDRVEVLQQFADKWRILFDLLSDVGSVQIRRLGLFNQHLDAQQAAFGRPTPAHVRGVPYPGVFLLDEAGVVVARDFEQSYRTRPTIPFADDVLLRDDRNPAIHTSARGGAATLELWTLVSNYRATQRFDLYSRVDGAAGVAVVEPMADVDIRPSRTIQPPGDTEHVVTPIIVARAMGPIRLRASVALAGGALLESSLELPGEGLTLEPA